MTAPTIAWMRYPGHAWRPNMEMAASMLIPTFAVMGALWAGGQAAARDGARARGDAGVHARGMLLRRDEYSCAAQARVARFSPPPHHPTPTADEREGLLGGSSLVPDGGILRWSHGRRIDQSQARHGREERSRAYGYAGHPPFGASGAVD